MLITKSDFELVLCLNCMYHLSGVTVSFENENTKLDVLAHTFVKLWFFWQHQSDKIMFTNGCQQTALNAILIKLTHT